MRQIATGRIVGLLIAMIAIGISILCARDAVRMNREFHQWLVARPMETAIDLSKPGEATIPFYQTCNISHGEALYLDCNLENESTQNTEEVFADLSGNVVIKDSDGNVIESVMINDKSVQFWDGKIMLAGFAPFPNGDYMATIRVDSGAAALIDKEQTIYAEYQLCGLEQMPAMIAGAFAFGVGLIGFVAAVCVFPGLIRCGIWRTTDNGEPEPPTTRKLN
ncbi:MAG: hypothetical protein DWQ34_09665 [Planctomycetota bacterium]|mgnify:CR=1 FL=1|nr:MAG: hypothetical protein DWQ34_09665 [Planctomycetota bacterium]